MNLGRKETKARAEARGEIWEDRDRLKLGGAGRCVCPWTHKCKPELQEGERTQPRKIAGTQELVLRSSERQTRTMAASVMASVAAAKRLMLNPKVFWGRNWLWMANGSERGGAVVNSTWMGCRVGETTSKTCFCIDLAFIFFLLKVFPEQYVFPDKQKERRNVYSSTIQSYYCYHKGVWTLLCLKKCYESFQTQKNRKITVIPSGTHHSASKVYLSCLFASLPHFIQTHCTRTRTRTAHTLGKSVLLVL